MKKLVYILIIMFTMLACNSKNSNNGAAVNKVPLDSAGKAFILHQDSLKAVLDTVSDPDTWFDVMNGEGYYILVRGAERNYDTIIDHIHYVYTTEE